ncbi:MAG TPA: hypothetical protein VFD70_18735 [Anaerolineae bacterium]|nr:hypothetical protein [Anaerolineae bacterium]
MFKRSSVILFINIVALAIGMVGDGLLGGVAGYSLAATRAAGVQSAVSAQLISAQVPCQAPAVSNTSARHVLSAPSCTVSFLSCQP